MLINSKIKDELEQLHNNGLYRKIPFIAKSQGKYIEIEGKICLNCSTNDYLGLADNAQIKKASKEAIKIYGNSSKGSRIVSGNFYLYDKLEEEMAKFKGYEKCLVVNSGYTANLLILSSLIDKNSVVFTDKLNHASIYDGIRMSEGKMVRYNHNDVEHLEKLLKKYAHTPFKFLVTDTVFSMDGDMAKIKEIAELKNYYNFTMIVDEAHATGIYGNGRGLCHEYGLDKIIDVNMGTFSKAFGGLGGYICSDNYMIDFFINKGRSFIYTTALPPSVIGGNLKALELIRDKYERFGGKLLKLSKIFKKLLIRNCINTTEGYGHIFPFLFENNQKALTAQKKLIECGVFAGLARKPTVQTPRLRISLRADFNNKDLLEIVKCLKKVI